MLESLSISAEPVEDDPPLPRYSDPGWLLVEIFSCTDCGVYRYDIEVLGYDNESSVMWINEGVGFDYWMDQYVDLEEPGVYLIQGITGTYFRGDGWSTDDDEEWDFEYCRYASAEEIKARAPA